MRNNVFLAWTGVACLPSPTLAQPFSVTWLFLHLQVVSVRATGIMAERGFSCGCAIAKLSSGGCLFAPRVGSELVLAETRAAMLSSMDIACKDQQLRAALQVTTTVLHMLLYI